MKQSEAHWCVVTDLIAQTQATTSASTSGVAATTVQGQVTMQATTSTSTSVLATTTVQGWVTMQVTTSASMSGVATIGVQGQVTTSVSTGMVVTMSVQAPVLSTGTTSTRADSEQKR